MISGYNYSQNKSNPQLILELLFITGAIVIHNEKKNFIKLLSISWWHTCLVYNLDQIFPFYYSADLDNYAVRSGMKLSIVFSVSWQKKVRWGLGFG